MTTNQFYQSIGAYQTRILRLHGHNGEAESPIRCDLFPADIVDESFGGIGVRSTSHGEDYIIPYEALSYCWGNATRSKSITCNNTPFAITENLYSALRTLRASDDSSQYIWIDAMCINQLDMEERSRQVQNMLLIYRRAKRVIGWLGQAHPNTRDLLSVLGSSPKLRTRRLEHYPDMLRALDDLYTRPWFTRMWVQQEIRAARELVLRCGELQFSWCLELSDPEHLLPPSPKMTRKPSRLPEDTLSYTPFHTGLPFPNLRKEISYIRSNNAAHLRCFELFTQKDKSVDFVETLLITGLLQATDPKDYIYGILGLTDLPAKPMSMSAWAATRSSDLYIPIDYSADLVEILATVTWVAVLKAGLSIIAKFKSCSSGDPHSSTQLLPSWVIDWRVAAELFRRKSHTAELGSSVYDIKVNNAWNLRTKDSSRLVPGNAPPQHEQFVADNTKATQSVRTLVVRGYKTTQYFTSNNHVYHRMDGLEDKMCWDIPQGTENTDVVVFLLGFKVQGVEITSSHQPNANEAGFYRTFCEGLWLLRPVREDEYKLIAYLPGKMGEHLPLYEDWEWYQQTGHAADTSQNRHHHRLAASPRIARTIFLSGLSQETLQDIYKFVLV